MFSKRLPLLPCFSIKLACAEGLCTSKTHLSSFPKNLSQSIDNCKALRSPNLAGLKELLSSECIGSHFCPLWPAFYLKINFTARVRFKASMIS